jgi:SAM-dependent methyltransferase
MKKELIFLSSPEEVSMADEWFDIANVSHFWMEWRLAIIEQVLKKIDGLSPRMRFLEIGCGHGEFLLQSDARLNVVTDGCDLNLFALNKISDVNGDVYVYDILELNPNMILKYNGVFLLDVIEHIDRDDEFLKAAINHVIADGLIIINVPALSFLFSDYDVVAGHKRRYSKKQIENLLRSCDIEPLYITYWGFSLLGVALLRKLFLKFVPRDKVINAGFSPGSAFVNKAFKILMKLEVSIIKRPFLGTSIIAIGRKKKI